MYTLHTAILIMHTLLITWPRLHVLLLCRIIYVNRYRGASVRPPCVCRSNRTYAICLCCVYGNCDMYFLFQKSDHLTMPCRSDVTITDSSHQPFGRTDLSFSSLRFHCHLFNTTLCTACLRPNCLRLLEYVIDVLCTYGRVCIGYISGPNVRVSPYAIGPDKHSNTISP